MTPNSIDHDCHGFNLAVLPAGTDRVGVNVSGYIR